MKKWIIFTFFCSLCAAEPFTEAQAVRLALKNNPDIKIQSIGLGRDSLDLKKAQAEGMLKAEISGNQAVELHPATQISSAAGDSTGRSVETSLKAGVSRTLPGGANVSASIQGQGTKDLKGDQSDYTTVGNVGITQPLLKDAWSNAPVDYQIRIEKKNLAVSAEKFREQLRGILSKTREDWLDWVSTIHQAEIRKAELDYASNTLAYERARFKLGEKAEMDTLTAALELLRARENLLSAEFERKIARKRFALQLGLAPDEIPELGDTVIVISAIPSAEAIMGKVMENDYQLRFLDLTREILELQAGRHRNSLLPRVDVSAGLRSTQRSGSFPTTGGTAAGGPDVVDPWIGISFSYDILARKERYAKKQTELSLVSNEIEKRYADDQQKVAVDEFVDAWAQDSARLDIRSAEVAIAEKNFRYAEQRYELGEIDNLERLKARNDLTNARLGKLLAEVGLKRLEIAVDNATANVFNRFGVNVK